MDDAFVLYGATGYTGALVARAAAARGLRPLLMGRDAAKLAAAGRALSLPWRAAALGPGLADALHGARVVLHAAGPFGETWRPMVDSCLAVGAHYLDLSGEAAAIAAVAGRHADALARSVMLMPAVGFDVVPSDCLAAHLAARLPGARSLDLGVRGLDLVSRGSLRTLGRSAGAAMVRRAGELRTIPLGSLRRSYDFGAGLVPAVAVAWGDVVTARYTAGFEDVTVWWEETPALRALLAARALAGPWADGPLTAAMMDAWSAAMPAGPSERERHARRATIVGEARDAAGRVVRARVDTPEAYTATCVTSLAVVERVLRGDFEAGFQTPARVYGEGFAASLPGIARVALPDVSIDNAGRV